jgi:hypothetical protein
VGTRGGGSSNSSRGNYNQGPLVPQSSAGGADGRTRRRKLSLDGMESVEEGAAIDMQASRRDEVPGRRQMNIGRKKLN